MADADERRWRVSVRQKQSGAGRLWNVLWHHSTENSSWWTDDIIRAETAEDAAQKMLRWIDVEEHTQSRDRRVEMRVYGPIPEDFETFKVGEVVQVDRA